MKTFQDLGLSPSLIHTLTRLQFHTPTPIQAEAIPVALEGKDVLGSAQTGTGKTGAFAIPLITKILSDPKASALVMTPTRELATQVLGQIHALLGKDKAKTPSALLIGGEAMPKQLAQLHQNPRILVGTPGRINDHLKRGSLDLSSTDFLVLDETDRMLDMGFTIQIENVMQYMAKQRQTLLFSATLPADIVQMAKKYLNQPVRVAVDPTVSKVNIQQDNVRIGETEKYPHLLSQLQTRQGSVIIFVKTKFGTEKMAAKLVKEGHHADAIHGDLRQSKRDRVITNFRNKKYRILVATDVAARGLDIPHIAHVINYDLPQCADDYIHRIGRTARAGAEGSALNLISPADRNMWNAIDHMLNPHKKPPKPMGKNTSSSPYKKRPFKGAPGKPTAPFRKGKKPGFRKP